MEEIWKDIPDYEGLYQVSNLGRVRSLDKEISFINRWGQRAVRTQKGKIMKTGIKKNGYEDICLSKLGIREYPTIHRLVAKAFMPNPEELPCINHKDENKLNNNVNNLEYCSFSYNRNYGEAPKILAKTISNTKKGQPIPRLRKAINQFTLDGTFIKTWDGAVTADKELKIPKNSICSCLKGRYKTAGGYIWKYA